MRIGRYEITGELGRGAMGVVYRAYDPNLDREVALKELSPSGGSSGSTWENFVARFFTEARAAARLTHPSIVTIHDVGQEDSHVYLTMEILEGPTLLEVIEESGAVPASAAEPVLTQVAEGLAAAHRQGVVHRDIKPDNCFWLMDGRVKIADFGIARLGAESSGTVTGAVIGTPGYMSPEQVKGRPVTPASDIFSWGATAFHLLTGEAPFGMDDAQAVMYRVVNESVSPPGSRQPGISASLDAIVCKALAKEPMARYLDGTALVEDLQNRVVPVEQQNRFRTFLPRSGSPQPQPNAPAADELAHLADLYASGALSIREFEAGKARILGTGDPGGGRTPIEERAVPHYHEWMPETYQELADHLYRRHGLDAGESSTEMLLSVHESDHEVL